MLPAATDCITCSHSSSGLCSASARMTPACIRAITRSIRSPFASGSADASPPDIQNPRTYSTCSSQPHQGAKHHIWGSATVHTPLFTEMSRHTQAVRCTMVTCVHCGLRWCYTALNKSTIFPGRPAYSIISSVDLLPDAITTAVSYTHLRAPRPY